MAQHDYVIDNSTGAGVRADINNALLAISSSNSGSSAPSTVYPSQFFANTSTSIMQLNNTSGNAFINLFTLAGGPAFAVDGTINNVNIGKGANSVAGNTCLGVSALDAAVSGQNNTAIGADSLTTLTSGGSNTGCGNNSLKLTTTGSNCVGIGKDALKANTTGASNTAVGMACLESNTTADNNTALGKLALGACSSGDSNCAVGATAGDNITTGSNNTCIGNGSDAASASTSNSITLGNSSISSLRCQVQTISSLSDARDKTNIVDIEDGLDLINLLKPKKFTWAMRQPSANDGTSHLGFIAQELDEVIGNKNDYMHLVDKTNPDKLEAAYSRLIPILTKAIQELSAKVTALEAG